MFGDFNCSTRAGASYNEDAIFYNEKLLIVMDGASSLKKVNLTSEASDAHWLSKNTVSRLSEYLSSSEKPVLEALKKVSGELKKEFDSLGCREKDMYPSGSIMVARVAFDMLEIVSIGDLSAIVEFNDREELFIHDDSVTKLDKAVINKLKKWREESGKSILELKPLASDMLISNRNKRNTDGGYWIFDPTGEAVDHATVLSFKLSEVKSIAIMSDGFYMLSLLDGFSDNKKILDAIKNIPAEKLIDSIFSELDNDAALNKHPRFKLKDDASVVYAKIKVMGE